MQRNDRIGLRVPKELKSIVAAVGSESPATRALLILGAAVTGFDVSSLHAEMGKLLGEPLSPPVRDHLFQLYSGAIPVRLVVPERQQEHLPTELQPAVPVYADAEFDPDDIGIDV